MERLQLTAGRKPTLDNVKIRPPIGGRKLLGRIEAHKNGFRYMSIKNHRLEIVLKNIKHAFFQPCEQEFMVLIHFHLHDPILIGKKMAKDVQFYIEAGVQAEEIDSRYGRRGAERNWNEEDMHVKRIRRKLNTAFKGFCQVVEKIYRKHTFKFDGPFRALGFYGCPIRSNVFLLPTLHCLIAISEQPFFVMSLAEVEVCHFERISYNLRNFDLVFIFKDYTREPTRISAIPVAHKETIMNWLNQIDIVFSMGPPNLNWKNLMKNIRQNPKKFIEDGSWG